MLVRIPTEEVLVFFKMLDNTIQEKGVLYIGDGRIEVKGDKGKGVMVLGYFYQDIKFPPIELTKEDIENLKKVYIDYLFTKYRYTDLIIVKYEKVDDVKFEFIFGNKWYVL
ncbi:MAG: hypothetical protein JHC31_06030 [Sulfurihydrogenibium sp.]|nr:hypothetical protein [Sulfurihydrogenibium sp.]